MKYIALSALLTLAACDQADDSPTPPPTPGGQGGAGGGQGGPGGGQGEAKLVWPAQTDANVVLVVPNLDDDNKNGEPDFADPGRIEDDDLGHIRATLNGTAQLSFEGDTSKIRVYQDGQVILGKGADATFELSHSGDAPVELAIEVAESGKLGTLKLGDSALTIQGVAPTMGHHLLPTEKVWVVEAKPDEPEEGLSDAEAERVTRVNNNSMIAAMREALGDKLIVVTAEEFKAAQPAPPPGHSGEGCYDDGAGNCIPVDAQGGDPWMQDEFEMFGLWTPDAEAQLTMNSPRNGVLDWVVRKFLAPQRAIVHLNNTPPADANVLASTTPSQDYGGNLETSPPVTVEGVEYPLGRIYYGAGPSETVKSFLHGTEVQKPIVLDVSWLCVGHIDEVLTFLPDPKAPRGFRMFVADTTKGVEMIRGMDQDLRLTRYGRKIHESYGYNTPAEILADEAVMTYNQKVQRDHIEPTIDVMRRELALTDEEIVRVPMMFYVLDNERAYGEGNAPGGEGEQGAGEEQGGEGEAPGGEGDEQGGAGDEQGGEGDASGGEGGIPGRDGLGAEECAEALFPDTVNMLMVTNATGDGGTAVIPDPFLRTDESAQDDDPLIKFWKEAAPEGVKLLFVDDWYIYHLGGGEVHCGTNQSRQPALSTLESLDRWTRTAEEK